MDVVRTNIDKIGGTIDVKSVSGKGTSFTVKIPLTLAIVSALIVACGGERFAIPQLSVVELVGVSGDTDHKIEKINETPVLRLRNRLLPLVNLRDVLGLTAENGNGEDEGESGQGGLAGRRDRAEHVVYRRQSGRQLHLRNRRRQGVRYRGNRRQAGGTHPARHRRVLG